MKLFFEPKKVALIGASATAFRPGNNLYRNMKFCFGEDFYPINPRMEKIGDKLCYPSVLDVPETLDLVVIFIQARKVPPALEQCAQRGVNRVIIESGGFAETGADGRALTERCLQVAQANGMRIWGPNCMGLINVRRQKVLSFLWPGMWQERFISGNTSLVVQSGMLSAGFLSTVLFKTPFGLSKICSIGNKMDVDEVDVLEYLLQDRETGVVGMYLESVSRGREFFELARSTDKPIVVLKAGRTRFGSTAAASHTAALAQDDRVLDGAFRQAGIIRVRTMNELLEVARCMDAARSMHGPRGMSAARGLDPTQAIDGPQGKDRASSGAAIDGPKGKDRASSGVHTVHGEHRAPTELSTHRSPRVAVLTFSGGAGVVSSDDVHDLGMDLAVFTEKTLAELKQVFPDWMEPSNPVDLYPAVEKRGPLQVWPKVLTAVLEDPGVDAVLAHVFAPGFRPKVIDVEQLAGIAKGYDKPMTAWIMGAGEQADALMRELTSAGIPALDEPAKAVRILAAITMRR